MDTFTKESIQFFSALKRNNNRKWFEKNKERYEVSIKNPANLFLLNFAKEMKSEFPNLVIDKKSMYRIYRDTRFSKDKTPYKTHAGFLFYDRRFAKDESPAFYFGFDPTGFAFGFGVFRFLGTQRAIFRERVMNGKPSVEFTNIIKTLKKKKYVPRGLELKKIPEGFDPSHTNVEFTKYNGLYVVKETDLLPVFYTSRFKQFLKKEFLHCKPLYEWYLGWMLGLQDRKSQF